FVTMRALFSQLVMLLPLLAACEDRENCVIADLRRAEAVVSERPDSAVRILNGVERPEALPEPLWARWALLSTQARDKAFIPHTTDSVINRVVAYYDRSGDPVQKALAYYYLGRVNSDLRRLKRATAAYLRAADYVSPASDPGLAFRILTQAGTLYAHQGLDHEAMEAYQKAFAVAEEANDSVSMAFGYAYIGRIYGLRKEWEQANASYLKAIDMAERVQDDHALRLSIQELAGIYTDQNRLEEALSLAERLPALSEKSGIPENGSCYMVIGDIYRKWGQVDSAVYYFHRAVGYDNIYTQRSAYHAFYYLYSDQGMHEEANRYNDLYKACGDSIKAMGSASTLYQVKERHQTEKWQESVRKHWLLTGTAGFLLLILLAVVVYFCFKYRRGERWFRQESLRLQEEERDLRERMERLLERDVREQKRNQGEIERLNRLLEENRERQEQLESESKVWQRKYRQVNERFKGHQEKLISRQAESSTLQSPTIEETIVQLRKNARYLEEWEKEAIRMYMDMVCHGFTRRLSEANPALTEGDLLVACLIRLGFSLGEMAVLLAIDPKSVSKRKQRLRKNLSEPLAGDAKLMDYLRDF
ncbi:MAG: hypothetical protein PHC95_03320, partial [Parabacteroides sp.]|nr:hypothetical protein [Parabacteroides sp.]